MNHITVIDHRGLIILLGAISLAVFPHVTHLPIWFGLLMLAIGIWRYFAALHNWRLPSLPIRILLVAAAMGGIYFNFNTLFGRDAGVALLAIMLAMKLLELKQRRDVLVILFLTYFTLSTHFLYDQSPAMAAYVATVTFFVIGLHMYLSQGQQLALKACLKQSGRIALQAVPLALVLFLLFPRIPGPLWGLPNDAHSGMTGLSDQMSPGNISSLGQSDEVAFRVQFKDEIPKPSLRYWRGPVLWDTDGRTWRNVDGAYGYSNLSGTGPQVSAVDHSIEYTVTLEPHNRHWLFGLDIVAIAPEGAHLTPDFQILTTKPVQKLRRYDMMSYTQYNSGPLDIHSQRRALYLPANTNPRAVAMGEELRLRLHDDEAIIRAMLAHYRQQQFIYTLTPPLLTGNHPADQFLFDTQRGFCEHFASSFTVVMRAAGIPTRVVTGYQGGDMNSMGDYMIIRQMDAHAWTEVWLENKGWTRIDPTAAVAPERIESGTEFVTQDKDGAIIFNLSQRSAITRSLLNLRDRLDAMNNAWNQWVLGFDNKRQFELLSNLGADIKNTQQLVMLIIIAVITTICLTIVILMLPKRQHLDVYQQTYQSFCRKLAKKGLPRSPDESAQAYCQRISLQRPELAKEIAIITMLYNSQRYGAKSSEKHLSRLKKHVSQFRP